MKRINTPTEDLESLVALIESGQLDKVYSRMRARWRPRAYWDREDVQALIMLLRGLKRLHGDKATPIYQSFAEHIKVHVKKRRGITPVRGLVYDYEWLMSLHIRAEIVEAYEGPDEAIAWLQLLIDKIPSPDNGIVYLLLARVLMSKKEPAGAREHLSRAISLSLAGMQWYRLEALNTMVSCLVMLGESRLAFEYARTHSIESDKLGACRDDNDLFKAIYGLSLIFGQIDYLVDVKKNLARRAREKGNHPIAAIEESDAGLRLAQIGARDESVIVLRQAAEDADRGSNRRDSEFASTCRLLARYLDPIRIARRELVKTLEAASQWLNNSPKAAVTVMERNLRDKETPDAQLLNEWQREFDASLPNYDRPSQDTLIHLTALLARFYAENGDTSTAHSFYDAVTGVQKVQKGIVAFVREDYTENLIRAGKLETGFQLLKPLVHQTTRFPHERFVLRQLAARCCLAMGLQQEAYSYAKLGLSDWARVLEGLYSERHKVDWLRYGGACLSCAINAIRTPVSWMSESERYGELFGLVELGKARLVTDMVNHIGGVPGVYLRQSWSRDKHKYPSEALSQLHPDWLAPILFQGAADVDAVITYLHDNTNPTLVDEILQIDMTALRSVIQLPLSPEKRLYATADSVAFEESKQSIPSELWDDLMRD